MPNTPSSANVIERAVSTLLETVAGGAIASGAVTLAHGHVTLDTGLLLGVAAPAIATFLSVVKNGIPALLASHKEAAAFAKKVQAHAYATQVEAAAKVIAEDAIAKFVSNYEASHPTLDLSMYPAPTTPAPGETPPTSPQV